jgi:hypothetical protein
VRLGDPARWWLIVRAAAAHALLPEEAGLPFLAALLLWGRWLVRGAPGTAARRLSAAAALACAGFFFVYAALSAELAWHLETSASRLLWQLLPTLLLIAAAALRSSSTDAPVQTAD